ncbi:MAG: type II CAAX endopeptidase family protein [Bacteroidota bacterium]
MEYRSVKGHTGGTQLGILIGLISVGFILTGITQIFLGYKAMGTTSIPFSQIGDAMTKALMKPENSFYLQLSQILGTFFLLFLPAFGFIFICHRKISWAGFNKHFSLAQIGVAFLIIMCATFFASPFADLTRSALSHFPDMNNKAISLEKMYNDAVAAMSGLSTWPEFFIGILMVAFFPALFEELFFRGVIQNFLVKWTKRPVIAIVITSIVFSLIHFSFYLFISRFILGYALGLLFHKSKNIWVNTFAHFMNNFLALVQLFYLNKTKHTKIDVNDMDVPMPLWSVAITLAILVGLFILFEKLSVKNRELIEAKEALEIPRSNNPFPNYE